jgi:Nitroreductase family
MQAVAESAWDVGEDAFPAGGAPDEVLRYLLEWAVLAPSSHNTQPWRFRVDGGAVRLYADRARSLPVVDPRDRALTISCGAALFYLRLAVRRFGWLDDVEVFPDVTDPDLLAVVRLGDRVEPGDEVLRLFGAVKARHTWRQSFDAKREVPAEVVAALLDAADDEGGWLRPVSERRQRSMVADLARLGDGVQFADPDFRHELAAWIRSNGSGAHDGMPGYAFGIPDVVSPFASGLIDALNLGAVWGGRSHQAVENAPVLAVLGTGGDTPRDWLAAGQALARVLLRAAADGVEASFLNQPVEVPLLRLRLRSTLAITGWPQLLLRMGYPRGEARPTPRRTIDEVLVA